MPPGHERLERRLTNMLMTAIPESLQADLVAGRELRPQAILFKALKTFQPGGLNERSETLAALTSTQEATTAAEAVQRLRLWKRQWTRAQELGASTPDPVLLIGALDAVMRGLLTKDSQAMFRVSTYRMANEVDIRPTATTVMQYHELLQGEADLMLAGTVASGSGSKGQPEGHPGVKAMVAPPFNPPSMPPKPDQQLGSNTTCRWWGTDDGCRKGKACKFYHGILSDRSSRCWTCSSKNHRKSECPYRQGGQEQPRSAAGGSGLGGPGGGKEGGGKDGGKGHKGGKPHMGQGEKPKGGDRPQVAAMQGAENVAETGKGDSSGAGSGTGRPTQRLRSS